MVQRPSLTKEAKLEEGKEKRDPLNTHEYSSAHVTLILILLHFIFQKFWGFQYLSTTAISSLYILCFVRFNT